MTHTGAINKARKRLLNGEELSGSDYSQLSYLLRKLEEEGYVINKRRDGHFVFYSVAGSKTITKPTEPAPVALPQLGGTVTITALVLNSDGSYSIGLRNGKAAWLTRLTSQT